MSVWLPTNPNIWVLTKNPIFGTPGSPLGAPDKKFDFFNAKGPPLWIFEKLIIMKIGFLVKTHIVGLVGSHTDTK